MKTNKGKIALKIISILFTIVCLFSFTVFGCFLFKINIIPNKYLFGGVGVFLLLIILLLFLIYSRRKKIVKIISIILMTILAVISIIASTYLNNTYNFFTGTNKDYDTLTYSVVVLKNSNYKKLNDLNNKTIAYLNDNYKSDINKYLKENIKYDEILMDNFSTLSDQLLNSELDAIVLEESYLILVEEEIKDFKNSTKTIETFEVSVKTYKEDESSTDITKEPFVLYISGIDQYGNVKSVRGRSDVNQIVVINPRTNHILLVNTPRDYYVQLAGTTGLKDKLTHAGIYGIDKSIKTLEEFYNVDIDHYLRVNFNTLIKVVDVIGGIDIYSDKAFTAHTNRSVKVKKGWNSFNGTEALAYSRERYAYVTGDHHRGANQQQVITAIIEKVSKSEVLISKYNSILNALDGSFQTDMSTSMITSFIKYQLDKMPEWDIESIAVSGYNSSNYTYSMGTKYKLYVMEPDYNSVNEAKTRIKEVLNES